MKFTTSLSVATIAALWNVFVAAAPATTETGNSLEPRGIVVSLPDAYYLTVLT